MIDPPDSTAELITRARTGDRDSLEVLVDRCLPPLRRWARGRLPRYARDLLDTEDLVQETVSSLRHLDSFDARREGALQAYLRQAVVNRIRDEIRRVGRRPNRVELDDDHPHDEASPLEEAIGHELLDRYEAAIATLKPEEREAIVARIELQYSYEQVAEALGKPSSDAARMTVARALLRLAEVMDHGA
jgi:RNA polymerase sigma-70 factor (ECF subfamily)